VTISRVEAFSDGVFGLLVALFVAAAIYYAFNQLPSSPGDRA